MQLPSGLIMLIMAVSRVEELQGIIFWIMGSLEESNWFLIITMLLVSLAGLLAAYLFCFDLNALALGEEEARSYFSQFAEIKSVEFKFSPAWLDKLPSSAEKIEIEVAK